jgi:hypothetical protein
MNAREHAVSYLKWIRRRSAETLKGFPEDKLCFQNCPADNHPLWVMGHLALTDQWIGGLAGVSVDVPARYAEFFGQGTKPQGDARKYPPAAEVRQAFDDSRAALVRWLETAAEAMLAADLREQTGGFATDMLDAFLKLGWHEGWHFGQVATLRKSLSLPSAHGG